MCTTLTLDSDCAEALTREHRRRAKSTCKQIINELLRANRDPKPPRKFKVRAHDFGATPGLNFDNIGALLE